MDKSKAAYTSEREQKYLRLPFYAPTKKDNLKLKWLIVFS